MAGEHVPEIERYIRTLKDRTQSAYNVIPFKNLPWAMLIHPFKNGTLWLNAFPAADGMSSVHSPHFLLIGRELSFDKHAVLELGSYVQTHEEHSNGMEPQTMGAICLGPMGNAQGGHWFFSLTPGCRVVCHCWTALPMPQEVFLRVSQIGRTQVMPSRITYANRQGDEISDRLEDFFDEDDASSSESDDDTYTENWSHQDSEDDETTVSNDETTSSDDNDDDDPQGNPHPPANEMHDPAVPDPAGSFKPVDPDDEGDEGHDDENRPVDMDIPVIDGIDGSSRESEEWEGECENDAFSNAMSTEEIDKCEGECESDASSSVTSSGVPPTESEKFEAAEAARRAAGNSQVPSTESEQFEAAEAARRAVGNSHDDARRKSNHGERRFPTRKRIPARNSALQYLITEFLWYPTHRHKMEENMRGSSDYNFLTAQMSAKRGLCQFRQKGVNALMKELQQLIDWWVMWPCDANILSRGEKKSTLKYLMFLKEE